MPIVNYKIHKEISGPEEKRKSAEKRDIKTTYQNKTEEPEEELDDEKVQCIEELIKKKKLDELKERMISQYLLPIEKSLKRKKT